MSVGLRYCNPVEEGHRSSAGVLAIKSRIISSIPPFLSAPKPIPPFDRIVLRDKKPRLRSDWCYDYSPDTCSQREVQWGDAA